MFSEVFCYRREGANLCPSSDPTINGRRRGEVRRLKIISYKYSHFISWSHLTFLNLTQQYNSASARSHLVNPRSFLPTFSIFFFNVACFSFFNIFTHPNFPLKVFAWFIVSINFQNHHRRQAPWRLSHFSPTYTLVLVFPGEMCWGPAGGLYHPGLLCLTLPHTEAPAVSTHAGIMFALQSVHLGPLCSHNPTAVKWVMFSMIHPIHSDARLGQWLLVKVMLLLVRNKCLFIWIFLMICVCHCIGDILEHLQLTSKNPRC